MQDMPFSLTRVRLRNFRSIADADVALGRLLLLVGPNGSGKSNFLDALRLTSESLQTSLDQALRSRGGGVEVQRRSTMGFAIDLEFKGAGYNGRYGFEVSSTQVQGFRVTSEYCDVKREDESRASFAVTDGRLTAGTEAVMPPVSSQRLYLVSAAGLDAFRLVFDGLSNIHVFNLNPDVMRQPQAPDSGDFLDRDGSNIASVLRRSILDGSPRSDDVARIEEYLQQIVPDIRDIQVSQLGTWETLEFRMYSSSGAERRVLTFPAQSVSDGTLRALGVLVALFTDTGRTLSTVGIEEPESALHPAATGVLLDALRDASERRQVIVTSHSPDLLDRHDFDLPELRAVRSINGETVIGELDDAGALALREDLYTPGELLRTDQLLPKTPRAAETQ
jgi:predicted ATPase